MGVCLLFNDGGHSHRICPEMTEVFHEISQLRREFNVGVHPDEDARWRRRRPRTRSGAGAHRHRGTRTTHARTRAPSHIIIYILYTFTKA